MRFYRADERHSAMERTTGFGCAMFAYILMNYSLEDKGVIPPEILGMNEKIFNEGIELLKSEGIEVSKEILE